uniref:Vinculin n=1 Tax=Ciona savignyi TaxID=51511 RepID=H2Z5U1_CIOSA
FHTKTIEQILEPVAEQVSHLVILHEQGEDGAAMPSLMKPIQAVSSAVNNLATVGNAQIATTKDQVLKMDTPQAIKKVQTAADLLMDSAKLIEGDEYSKAGREKLIAGSRGILQGTSDLLLIFDEAEVRRICHVCRKVRDYLKVSEVVQGMEDLVTYVKNLTPGMTNLSDLVLQRSKDLTNALHADKLKTGVADLRSQLPNLISSMKVYVTTVNEAGVGSDASCTNREYYVKNLSDEITEIIRIAQILAANPQTAKEAAELFKLCDELDELMEKLDDYRQKGLAEDGGKGILAARSVMSDARRLAVECENPEIRAALLQNAAECESLCNRLADLVKRGQGNSPEAKKLAEELKVKLQELKQNMKLAVIGQVADEFSDTTTVLKQFVTAASAPKHVAGREEKFAEKSQALTKQAARLANLGLQAVATSELGAEEKVAKATVSAKKIQELTPQVINAGKIVLDYPDNKLAKDHLKALTDEWTEHVDDLTEQVDNAMDVVDFIKASEDGIKKDHKTCLTAIQENRPTVALPAAGNIARRAHRILMAGKREVENTDDAEYVQELKSNLNGLSQTINPMVQATREYAQNPNSGSTKANVKDKNDELIRAVSQVRNTVEARRIAQQAKNMVIEEEPPPVPPLPQENEYAPPVPPPPEEEEFPEEQEEDVPMMQAARELHEEARKWESKGNDIIAAAKRMALLMAKMSHLVRGEVGKKSDLIACAKEIAKASNDVTRLAHEVADKCTDRRIRTDMKKTLDRIPTISTQLRILSTVKAASLGDSTEMTKDEEEAAEQATEMLVHNAQNLMMSVKDTVRSAEAASIR